MSGKRMLGAAVALALAAAAASPALPRGEGPAALLGRLDPGLWQLRPLDGRRSPSTTVCLGDPAQLAQLKHPRRGCSRSPVASSRDSVTLSYDCPGGGSGQTTIRVETSRLVRIESQGLDNGAPYAFRAEARRVGFCG